MADMKLRGNWQTYRFDQIAQNVNVRVDNPSEAGVERYVGLEHLDPESLKIRRWGTPDEVEATKLRFWPGDIIFGRRRFYQRKLAIADFEGICSAHAMVLRAREDVVLPEFLPFFMQSETFFERAMAISVGSLSPTINWSALARQEFALPPMNEQRWLAEILWAAESCLEKEFALLENLTQLRYAFLEHFLHKGLLKHYTVFNTTPLGSVPEEFLYLSCEQLFSDKPRNGLSPTSNSSGTGYPTLSLSAVRDGKIISEDNIKYAEISCEELESYRLLKGDVLIVRGNGNLSLTGRCGVVDKVPEDCFYTDLLIRIRFDETQIRAEFACMQWNYLPIHRQLLKRAKSTNGIWKINGLDLRQHKLVVPPVAEQDEFLRLMAPIQNTEQRALRQIEKSQELKRKLLNTVLSPGLGDNYVQRTE
jgi:type I restriction enzyme S subunit